jgi:hypothetical protein
MSMTPRERILATLNHEVPDRVPTDDAFPAQTRKILLEHFETDDYADVLRELGVEGWGFLTARARVPEFDEVAETRTVGSLVRTGVWSDERTYRDEWGVVRAGVDMVSMWGDIAMQDRIITGPDTWREVDKPRMAKLVAARDFDVAALGGRPG